MFTKTVRACINADLCSAGFDGNGRFVSVSRALADVQTVLARHGIEVDEVLSADLFPRNHGHRAIRLAMTNHADLFSPASVEDHVLAFQWTELIADRTEALAYIS